MTCNALDGEHNCIHNDGEFNFQFTDTVKACWPKSDTNYNIRTMLELTSTFDRKKLLHYISKIRFFESAVDMPAVWNSNFPQNANIMIADIEYEWMTRVVYPQQAKLCRFWKWNEVADGMKGPRQPGNSGLREQLIESAVPWRYQLYYGSAYWEYYTIRSTKLRCEVFFFHNFKVLSHSLRNMKDAVMIRGTLRSMPTESSIINQMHALSLSLIHAHNQ